MQEFEAIRPYRDDEVPGVIARLLDDPRVVQGAAPLMLPALASLAPPLAHGMVALLLRWRTRAIGSVDDFQLFLSRYYARLIKNTIAELTASGLEALTPGRPYLYVSNHRDITMDTGLVNYALHKAGFETPEAAVGDNLFSDPLAADLMRLNKSFVIERSVTGKRALYRALTRTSQYIQHVLNAGHSVWIAQREGRSKDGFDRTDPALLKMLALAWRQDSEAFGDLLERINLVPVAISYELDPCDRLKAHELAVLEREGSYRKAPNEDLTSIIHGLTGYKGRVHVHFGQPVRGDFADSDALAAALDVQIVQGLKVFPTQAAAARELAFTPIPATPDWLPEVRSAYEQRLTECPTAERPFLLAGYGNLIRNRLELGIPVGAVVSGAIVA
ncbi:MAG: 1-acyl-sn-glycerol-3-phosphate acyltransferase [Pseudomonadales bacterium]